MLSPRLDSPTSMGAEGDDSLSADVLPLAPLPPPCTGEVRTCVRRGSVGSRVGRMRLRFGSARSSVDLDAAPAANGESTQAPAADNAVLQVL